MIELVGQENAEEKLKNLMWNEKWNEVIEFLDDDRLTSQNKTAAVNCNDGRSNDTTLIQAAQYGAPITIIQKLCEIGGKPLIMATGYYGMTALYWVSQSEDPNIDTVKYLVQNGGGEELINKQANDGNTALHAACQRKDPKIDTVKYLVQNGGGIELINKQANNGDTALHAACECERDDPNIDTVKYLVQNGGMELINKQNNRGFTALDIAKEKGNHSRYNFLKDALEFPFHALCSSIDVTASKIQDYLDHHEASCAFQTNHVSKAPLHNLSLNRQAPSDAIDLLIKAMLETKRTGGIDLFFKSTMKIAQEPTITDNALSSLLSLIPNLPTALLSYYKFNNAVDPAHASRIRKMITLQFGYKNTMGGSNDDPRQTPDRLNYAIYAKAIVKVVKSAELTDTYFCTGIFAPWGVGKTKLWSLIKLELMREKLKSNQDKSENVHAPSADTGPIKFFDDMHIDWDAFFGRDRLYNLKCILFGIVAKIFCLSTTDEDTDGTLPMLEGADVVLNAQKKERNEAVALLFVILSPMWIVLGVLIGLLQSYGKYVGLCFSLNTLTADKYGSLNSLLNFLFQVELWKCCRSTLEPTWIYFSVAEGLWRAWCLEGEFVLGSGSKFNEFILNFHQRLRTFIYRLSQRWDRIYSIELAIFCTISFIVTALVIPMTALAFIFDVLHALLYVLARPELIFEPIAKTSIPPSRAKDIVEVISAKQRLFHAFSKRMPLTPPSCLRLAALYPCWLLALSLSTFGKSLKKIVSSVWNFTGCCGRNRVPTNNNVKYIFVEFNAWTYNGSDNLWASFMETLWTQVESTFSKDDVRRHRASIALSNEDDSDDIETRTCKRNEALFRYYVTTILAFLVAVGGVGLGVFLLAYFGKCAVKNGDAAPNYCIDAPHADVEANLADNDEKNLILSESANITRYVFGILAVTISPLPFFKKLHRFIRDVLPAYISSPKELIQGKLLSEGQHERNDFSTGTGFMGIVKKEAGFLFDFVRTHCWHDKEQNEYRNVRFCIFVDDLDRCNSETIVSSLEAMFLLLGDSPITCYLAIDTRLVVASIDEHRLVHDRAGVSGYDFLEKIVQLEFCIPDLTNTKKQNYLKCLFYEGLLDPLALLDRICKLKEKGYTEILHCFQTPKKNGEACGTSQALAIIKKGTTKARNVGTSGFAFERLDEFYMYKQDRDMETFVEVNDFAPAKKEKFMIVVADYLMHVQKDMRSFGYDSKEASDTGELQTRNAGDTNDPSLTGTLQSAESTTISQSPSSTHHHNPSGTETVSSQDNAPRNEQAGVHNQIREEPDATANSLNNENTVVQNQVGAAVETMVTEEEQQWFNEFAKYLVSKARSITRVVNVYNTARYVSAHTRGVNTDAIFRRKLLQMLILVEFWPYRTSWLMQVVEDAGQYDDMKDCMVSTLMNTAAPVLDTAVLLRHIATMSIQQTAHEPTNFFQSMSLLDVYTKLVSNLIHSPADAKKMLSRDCDPQLFEQLLGDIGPAKKVENQLNMSDLLLPDQCEKQMIGGTTTRPFLFNMPRHMTGNASSCLDNLVLFYQEDNGQALVKYKYKKDYFHLRQQSLPSHHNPLSSASSDEIQTTIHHSIALSTDIQHGKFSKLEDIRQTKKEAYRNENNEFLKEIFKEEIMLL